MGKSKIKEVDSRANFPQMEDQVLQFWKENNIFEKSVEQRPEDNKYSFVDGPPFVSGMPHPAHLFVSVAKDVIPRYWTMKGKRVRRVFGWDCHGLPIENKVNQKYNLRGRKQIEKEFGVDRYVAECRKYVEEFSANWRWYIEKVGRWADLDNAYYTMYPQFNESVIWAFKQAWDKGLIYKGKRVSLYSTDTATPVSQFEVAMDSDNYADTDDLALFVKFELKENPFKKESGGKPVHLIAWTTTPWTLPANFALAVHANSEYVLVKFEEGYFVVAKDRLEYTFETDSTNVGQEGGKLVQIVKSFKGSELEGVAYVPLYDFFAKKVKENDYKVYTSDDVSMEEGSGVLHIAPAYGEVDFNFGLAKGLSDFSDIDEEGNMVVGEWKGTYIRDASPQVAEDLAKRGLLLRSHTYTHRLPYYRGSNPLIYMAQDAYFIKVQDLKDRILELNKNVNWIPSHFKEGRFTDAVSTAPDWCISRTRYWATIMPLWVSEDGDQIVVGSIEEMMEYTDQIEKRTEDGKTVYYLDGKPMSLHRDFCDKLIFKKDGKEYHRVPEVMDSWLDAGSVPFAEYHYPFENREEFGNSFPADFIVEYSGQVRAWFSVLFKLAVINFDQYPFKNVICHGVMAGNDGRKMSKTYGNYTDPEYIFKNLGGEAFRLYAIGSPLMAGGDINWSDEEINDYIKTVLIPLWNTYRYLTMYANMHGWTPKNSDFVGNSVMDRWLKAMVNKSTKDYADALERYDLPGSVRLLQPLIDGISTWWIRRSRDRFANGDKDAMQNLYAALVQFSKSFAPQLPFLTEEIYRNLVVGVGLKGGKESVHLEDYPVVELSEEDQKLLEDMESVRNICSTGLKIRDENRLKLRQPLSKGVVSLSDPELLEVVKSELNLKEIEGAKSAPTAKEYVVTKQGDQFVALNTNLTEELREEGLLNELLRNLQVLRKESGFKVGESGTVSFSTESKQLKKLMLQNGSEISSKVNLNQVHEVDDLDGTKLKIEGEEIVLKLEK